MGASTSKYKFKTNKHQPYRADKPSPPGKPTLKYDPNDLDPETVTIKWDPPLYDGGSKIIGYLVEHKRTGSPHWVKASPIKVRQTQLTVCGLEPGWRYQFRASAENENGLSDPSPLSEPLAIFVHRSAAIAPYFVTEIYDLAVLENEKVEFNVSFEGVPSPRISWYKDGLELFSNRCQKVSTEGCLSRYIIYEASISDESEIKCTATNKVGYAVTKAYLKVEAPPTIRLPRQYEDGLIFEKGELIRLKVSVVGQPRPLVFWSFNGERIDTNPSYETEYADSTAILRVKDAQRSDRGEYQIQAVNALGEDVASILVTIANRPQPPTNVFVERIEGNSVTLEWMNPEDDGGCKIGSYIIEYYKTGWNVWLKAATSRQLTITLEDLIAASQYRFRIKAENPYGVSDASQETETIFIPDVKKNIFRLEDVPKHRESEIFRFPFNLEQELQTASETDCSSENLTKKKLLLAPEKPKRKKIKVPMSNTLNASFMSNDNKDYQRLGTSSSQFSIPTDDVSRTSSELMLVLVPSLEDLTRCKGKGSLDGVLHFPSKALSNSAPSIPPPISLSAPELGSEIQFFKPLQRNCVSSTEILHESTIARFYKELQEENGLNKLKEQFNIISRRKSTTNSNEDKIIASGLSVNVSRNNSPIQFEKPVLKKRSPPEQTNDEINRSFSNLTKSKFVENNDHLMYENFYKSDLNDSTRSRSPTRRRKPDKLPDEPLTQVSSSESGAITQGRYSPLSGTFHYPDLFMESLTRSPQFKSTSRSLTEVVSDLASKKQILVESYAASTPLNELLPRKPNPKVVVTEHEDYNIYNSPLSSEFGSLSNELHGRNRYWNEDEESESDSLSEGEEEEVSSDEDDFDYRSENDTYHPRDRMPLSFEQALAISNPKRSVSPTNDFFLKSESLHADDKNDGLHYFNQNYDFDERDRTRDESRRPKSILKYSAYPNEFEVKNSSTSILTNGSSSLYRASSQTPSKLFKKQVRIEEPISRNNDEVGSTAKDTEDTSYVIINHYSDIVRHYSQTQKKPSTKLYLTYDELRAAAAEMDDDDIRDDLNDEEEVELYARAKLMEEDTTGTICDNYHLLVPNEQKNRRSPSPTNVDTILYVARVRQSVHFYFDFAVDLLLFILACWLFCFKDERLAVPVIILLVYRQLYEKVKDRWANFKFGWNNLKA